MKTIDSSNKATEQKKRQAPQTVPSRRKLMETIYFNLKDEKFKSLDRIYNSHSRELVETYFDDDGYNLFFMAFTVSTKSSPLRYLIQRMSKERIYDYVKRDKFLVLRCFIQCRIKQPMMMWSSDEAKRITQEKIMLLRSLEISEIQQVIDDQCKIS